MLAQIIPLSDLTSTAVDGPGLADLTLFSGVFDPVSLGLGGGELFLLS